MTISRFMAFLACGAMLALGACSSGSRTGGDPAELAAEKERADAATAELADEKQRAAAEQKRAADALAAEQKRAADALAAEKQRAADALAAEQKRAAEEKQRDADAHEAEHERAEAALTAERARAAAALDALRASLRNAQAALGAVGSGANARANAARALTAVEADLEELQSGLMALPASSARTAVTAAVTAVDTAVAAVKAALEPMSAAGGGISFASMHTRLDRAQAALDDAQTGIAAALGAEGLTEDLRIALSQAQITLSTAQNALVPVLRAELAEAEDDAAAQRARAVSAEEDAAEEKARADTYDPRISLTDAVTPSRRAGIRLPERLIDKGSIEADAEGPAVSWTARTRTDIDNTDPANPIATVVALDNDIKNEAVPWADGKTLGLGLGTGTLISTDEFTLRGITMRGGPLGMQNPSGARTATDNSFNPPVQGRADAGAWRNWNAAYESSIQMKADGSGIILKMGGDGTIFYDFERIGALGGAAALNQPENVPSGMACAAASDSTCDDVVASDVKATFGTPLADPDGESSWHFKMRVPVDPDAPHVETRDFDAVPSWALFRDDGLNMLFRVPDEDGSYEDGDGKYRIERLRIRDSGGTLLTANQANNASLAGMLDVANNPERSAWKPLETRRAQRIDRGRPSEELGVYNVWLSNYAGVDDKGTATDPSDDTTRYLSYAAYGLFNFLDYSTRGMNYARAQAFHFGYDAFSDADDNRPADWGTSAAPITATFNGRTTGWMIRGTQEESNRLGELIRLRGDVKLTATLDAGGADNQGTVTGSMNNFEFLRFGIWSTDVNNRMLLNDTSHDDDAAVVLNTAAIGADGSFSGVAAATVNGESGSGADNFDNGTYGGAFYGPRVLGMLEAAGHWNLRMNAAGGSPNPGRGALIGSFGAVSEPASP